ncbi:MAG: 3-hydroxy acid dehydrogenase/malonic semialdehyde reductase [Polaribacter sp.]|jgi:3-hydroxy acid dehydrogenase/malonic semialdehyde reductase
MSTDNPKLVIITGATSGFGKACAIKFAKNGWQIIATGRRLDRLRTLQNEIGTEICEIRSFDVNNAAAVNQFSDSLKGRKIDLLINNAGLALGISPAHQADFEDWETMIETNILALTRMTRSILPIMVENKNGHIINLGSIAGSYPYPGANVYGATKAFVEQFSLNLRADLSGTGVRVTNIEPGLANTEFSKVRFHGDKDKADSIYQGLEPLVAEDIAESIYWCASQPKHVNINRLEIMPTCQAFGPLSIHKN